MPTYPLIETIAQAIETQLEKIIAGNYVVGTTGNQYVYSVSEVLRLAKKGYDWTPKHLQINLEQGDTEVLEMSARSPAAVLRLRTEFRLGLQILPAEDATAPADQVLNIFVADVTRCLLVDRTFSGNAEFSEIAGVQQMSDSDKAVLTLAVQYVVLENDPYTKG